MPTLWPQPKNRLGEIDDDRTDQYLPLSQVRARLGEQFTLTAGGRYYDFSEDRLFKSGGLFSNGDNQTGSTKSDGFTPRVLASFKATDGITINAQASKGFRLGGINDPLNLPLCTPQDLVTFGGTCPKCFAEIPGEEAATDPGADVRAAIERRAARRFGSSLGCTRLTAVPSSSSTRRTPSTMSRISAGSADS